MKITTVIFVTTLNFFILHCWVQAQEYEYVPFPTENAIWSNYSEDPNAPYGYYKMNSIYALFNEDTIRHNTVWQKVYRFKDIITTRENAELAGFFQITDKQVYFSGLTGRSGVLYDFNLEIGDEVTPTYAQDYPFVVTNIDTVIYGNMKRKRFWFDASAILNNLVWIEGIGSTNGLLVSGDYLAGAFHQLLCFQENDQYVFYNNNFGTCFPDYPKVVTNIELTNKDFEMNIFPNPAHGLLNIQFSKQASGVIELVSFEGKSVIKKYFNNEFSNKLNLTHIHSGLYLVIFTSSSQGIQYKKKIIIY